MSNATCWERHRNTYWLNDSYRAQPRMEGAQGDLLLQAIEGTDVMLLVSIGTGGHGKGKRCCGEIDFAHAFRSDT